GREDRQDLVAVDDLALGGAGDQAVGVTVVGHAQVGTSGQDVGGQVLRVVGADAGVDVGAVGDRGDRGDRRAQAPQDRRGDVAGRPVGAVDDDVQPAQVDPLAGGDEVGLVALDGAGHAALAADVHADRPVGVEALQQLLDPLL